MILSDLERQQDFQR